ncbi:MAG: response regulator [Deltaproteobacteria bacterium]|nr:response regulator [Deltaproteobacteria bacterium]
MDSPKDITKILLIDDESDYSDTMAFYLKAKGYMVRTASNGRDGIDIIKNTPPDVVFLDFMMPEMDGVETLKKIREFNKRIPIIMVTSYASDEKVQHAREFGISAIFPKADDFSTAAKLIQQVLESPGLKRIIEGK